MDKRLESLREEYKEVEIPKELDLIVERTFAKKRKKRGFIYWPAGAVAAALLLTASVNLSPDAAAAMAKIPGVKGIIEVITFHEIKEEAGTKSVDVKTPALFGLDNKTLEGNLNAAFVAESEKLYGEYQDAEGHFAIDGDYDIIAETPEFLSIRQSVTRTQASAYTENRYLTVDKENEALILLPGLFKDDRYIEAISANIKEQMAKQMKEDEGKIYWLDDPEVESFEQIKPDQPFYINTDHQLVISFNEYEVAPGYMGPVEFVIPTDVVRDLLVGERYVR